MDFQLSEQQKALQQRVREFLEVELKPLEVEVELAEGYLSPEKRAEIREKIRPLNVHSSSLPRRVGGTEFSWEDQVIINEEIGKLTNALGWLIWAPAIVLKHANEYQVERWVRPAAEGKRDACYAVTEENAGSDASRLETTAVLDHTNHWIINGTKWHVTSGDVADFVVLQAATDPNIGDGNTLFIIDLDTPGVEVIDHPKYMHHIIDGHPRYRFKNVCIPDANRFGAVGEGLSISKEWFLHERVLIAARCCGAAERLIEEATAHAQQRVQFGSPIADYQMIQQKLADCVTDLAAARLLTFAAAHAADRAESEEDRKIVHAKASIAKLYASEMAGRVADHAVQIFGGRGYMRDNVAERFFRELRVERIWEGTSEIQRMIIAYSLYKRGIQRLIE